MDETYFVWDASPEIFSFLPVRWYGLLFALGFLLAYAILRKIFKIEAKSQAELETLTFTLIISSIIGARLGHCLFYDFDYYFANPIELIKVWRGGLASHGAAIGIFVGLWWFYRRKRSIKPLWLFDRIAIVVPLAAAFVRIGNFINSEILGKPTDVSWAVIFPRGDKLLLPRHPAQLYEAVTYLVFFTIFIFTYKKYKWDLPQGRIAGIFLIFFFLLRFLIEYTKEVQSGFENALPLDMGQILSIPFILAGIYILIRSFNVKPDAK